MPPSSDPAIGAEQALGSDARGFSFALQENQGRLELRALHRPDYGAIWIDWGSSEQRRRIAGGRKQLLARALGLAKRPELDILDATGGLGRDAFTLASLGARVTLVERQPQIADLLADAHRRALADPALAPIAARIELRRGNAALVLGEGRWDSVYLDPMYPHSGKTALPQKEMQIFRDLAGADEDADALLEPALQAARLRVAVKRPLNAPWMAARKPSLEQRGTQARFDIYLSTSSS
ncbi:class I SAM-dependent methyltransferase [Solimonas sp. SE-A11]|uniref:class I SAM-dependent methyltransferase n=1 Tax=Solimonas sp. SE-A11 TaxID=3054954 RepID=UPI00259C908E|nr:class I SAM-dependent methyltransferase [Solimonas sp. SE-A11]MDM4770199.1 class I SAM-dependent methyltransferase [Solimonas sp. SE-A11]